MYVYAGLEGFAWGEDNRGVTLSGTAERWKTSSVTHSRLTTPIRTSEHRYVPGAYSRQAPPT
jgi:hypothetical protein